MSSIYGMERPGFWRVPQHQTKNVPQQFQNKKKVHFDDEFVSDKRYTK
jgi:hypothetical protein